MKYLSISFGKLSKWCNGIDNLFKLYKKNYKIIKDDPWEKHKSYGKPQKSYIFNDSAIKEGGAGGGCKAVPFRFLFFTIGKIPIAI